MSTPIEITSLILVNILFLPAYFIIFEILLGLPEHKNTLFDNSILPNTAILVPAYNEEKNIAENLQSIRRELTNKCRLIVIADNCSDNTVNIAQRNGAEVLIRDNTNERGKGFALQYGIDYLSRNPPEVVVVIDADCTVHDGAIDKIARTAFSSGLPVQALYLMFPRKNASLNQQISAFAFTLKNQVRLLGLKRLGAPSHLTGSGMAFPWNSINTRMLASNNLVEDLQLGIEMVKEGYPPQFCPEALVKSHFPDSENALRTQKTRWEHGQLQTIISETPKLVLNALKEINIRRFLFAIDTAIPPLTIILFLLVIGSIISIYNYFRYDNTLLLILMFGTGLMFFLTIFLAWRRYGKSVLPVQSLVGLPIYVIKKITIYRQFVENRQKEWIRTDRE